LGVKLFFIFNVLLVFLSTACLEMNKSVKTPVFPAPSQNKNPNEQPQIPLIQATSSITQRFLTNEHPSAAPQQSQVTPNALADDTSDITNDPISVSKPFNVQEALSAVQKYFIPNEYPITNKGEMLYIMQDLNSDDIPEIIVPGVESEKPEYARFEFISRFARLYDKKKVEVPFNLYIFVYEQETFKLFNKIALGNNQVFKSFIKIYGNTKNNDPVILASTFQTAESTIHKWVIFKKPALTPISILEFEENIFKKLIIKDINNDHMIDVIIQEKSIEEGLGHETYLTWMKWNGRGYSEYKTINIVRNLNAFLAKVKELLIKGDMNKLLSFAISPNVLNRTLKSGLTSKEILEQFLGIALKENDETQSFLLGSIENIIFPDILDNPFYLTDEKGYYFPLSYRLVFQYDISIIAETVLYMNPFEERQFTFMPYKN